MFGCKNNNGISALPTILLISSILVEVVVVSVVLANALNNSRLNQRLATAAYSVASAGAEDAILRVIRYKNCPTDPECPSSYSLAVGSRTADVTITDNGGGIIIVESVGSALSRQKKAQAILGVSPITGEVSLQSFKEIAF